MNNNDNDQPRHEVTEATTFGFRPDFQGEFEASEAEPGVWEIGTLPRGAALLVVKRGPNAGSRFLLDRPVTTTGRLPGSDILLDDVTVSRRHAEFRLESGAFRIVDVGSLNGTFVNRKPVDSAVLAGGDEIQIGRFRLVFLASPATE